MINLVIIVGLVFIGLLVVIQDIVRVSDVGHTALRIGVIRGIALGLYAFSVLSVMSLYPELSLFIGLMEGATIMFLAYPYDAKR